MRISSLVKRSKNKSAGEATPFIVPGKSGEPFLEFPEEVIDSLRRLITRVNQREGFPRRLALTAALRNEGVSYLAKALAATMAHDLGLRVCLVDLNLWWPDPVLNREESPKTLAGVITGQTSLDEALLFSGWPNLAFLPAGNIPRYTRPMIAHSQGLRGIIDDLTERFDHLIIDTPAILATTDSVALASLSNAACLVVCQGVTPMNDVSQALDEIEHLQVAGVIMNRVQVKTPQSLIKMASF